MPAPEAVVHRFVLQGDRAWLYPTRAATPSITAKAAWEKLAKGMSGGGRAQLLLGTYTSIFPFKDGAPEHVDVLAWALFVQHAAIPAPVGPGNLGATGTTIPRPVCIFGTAFSVLNAVTGQPLVSARLGAT
jgi:hypothetical protein